MVLDGEDVAMGLAMVRDYLCTVGIKDGVHLHKPGAEPPYEPRYAQLGAGAVDWRRVVRTLAAMSFSGPWAVHTEYGPDPVEPAGEDRRRGRSLSAPGRGGVSGLEPDDRRRLDCLIAFRARRQQSDDHRFLRRS